MAGLIDSINRDLYCGATIISNRYALTAAHCMVNRTVVNTGLLVGDHDISTGKYNIFYVLNSTYRCCWMFYLESSRYFSVLLHRRDCALAVCNNMLWIWFEGFGDRNRCGVLPGVEEIVELGQNVVNFDDGGSFYGEIAFFLCEFCSKGLERLRVGKRC